MHFVITGATGFVGQLLVPILIEGGHRVTVVGRSLEKINTVFADVESITYENLDSSLTTADVFIHLAVVNNYSKVPAADFELANIELTENVFARAVALQVPRKVNVSTTHVLLNKNKSIYAKTKYEAVSSLTEKYGSDIENLYLPAVYGERWPKSVAFLDKMPRRIANVLFLLLKSIKATVHIQKVAEFLMNTGGDKADPQIILADNQSDNWVYMSTKRLVDIFSSGFGLIAGLPVFIVVGLVVGMTSKGGSLFRQVRVGQNEEVFTCNKFRTMKSGTSNVGTHEVEESSITAIGSVLRKTKLDEVPQLWNVLVGEMTLVGPRPNLPTQEDVILARRQYGVYKVQPGITGRSQIKKIDMSEPVRLAVSDSEYIALRSLTMDFSLVVQTILGKGSGDRIKSMR